MEIIKTINTCIAVLFFVCYTYQFFYIPVPLLKKDKAHKPAALHKFAVLIAARNEERVIAQLIDSIRQQDYPSELVSIFVVADNCTDLTADIARKSGASVYERRNTELVGKGYALDFLLKQIDNEFGLAHFDAYMVFDADNLLETDYISEMNKTFSDGYKIITSYRNSKNYGDNWISAGYSLWFMREARYLNHARMLLGTSCAVSGTGFMFSSEIIQKTDGWKFYLLTEDIEFTVHHVIAGEKVGFCKDAVFYDEQPIKFKQSWNQRLRWSKGYLQVLRKYSLPLFKGIFTGSFSCFDIGMAITPAFILSLISILLNITAAVVSFSSGYSPSFALFALWEAFKGAYLIFFIIGLITTVTEWRDIHTTAAKKLLFTLTFPLFMFTYIPISFTALFKKVGWQHIEHTKTKTLEEIYHH